ncbi:MAG: ABC transporter ATP-binding protein [Candidatus Colwellbacteria bacterium]|nr:ABC transporter ATP-binding protein [Candidatus Colwellbacteria bacterium]
MKDIESKTLNLKSEVTTGYVLKVYLTKAKTHYISGLLAIFGVTVAGVAGIWMPLYYKDFFDVLTSGEDRSALAPRLIGIIGVVFGINLITWVGRRISSFAGAHFQSRVITDLREQAFEYLLGHSYTFFANNFTGSLVQRVNRFARSFERLVDRFIYNIIPLIVNIIGAAVVLFFINRAISYVILIWMIVFLIFNYFFARWKLRYDIAGAAADSRTTAVLSDAVSNQNTIQLFTGFSNEASYFRDVSRAQANLMRFRWNLDGVVDGVQAFLVIGMEFLLFYYAIFYWKSGAITVGVFVLIQSYFIGLVMRLWDFSRVFRDIYEAFADAKEMAEILAQPHEIKNLPGAKPISVTKGKIEFKNLVFSFNETRNVLNKINLKIESGEKVALIGPSGAGKSTFFRLLLRFYDVAGGKILVDGEDVQRVTLESLRESMSLVPQDPLLFHRTLLENIRYGRREATDAETLEAARLAYCDEFAKDLPKGYDTLVGERGIKLSGGERQRVAIARALLKNSPVLLLDEATSSLDSHSESLIQDALEKLMAGKTVIVIAHRLSTIRKMDRIVVLDKGIITESGSHDELLAKEDSLYKKLWTLQSGGFMSGENEEAS